MTTAELMRVGWEIEPSIVAGCFVATGIYLWKVPARAWRRASFLTGILVLFLSLCSPLDSLGDDYLFSAHVAQHLLLILIVPPLLLFGIPEAVARQWMRVFAIAAAERMLGAPWPAWLAAMGTMTLWHLPLLYNYALAHESVHILQHLSFLATATMFWWPVLGPLPERRMQPETSIFYLFAAVAENSALGIIIIAFVRLGHYPAYLHPYDELGALALIRNGWGLSAAEDQRLGGLLMWIPGCSIYFVAILGVLVCTAGWRARVRYAGETR